MMGPGNRVSLAAQSLRYFKGQTQLCPSSYLEVRCMADNGTTILQLPDNHEDKSNMLRMVSWQDRVSWDPEDIIQSPRQPLTSCYIKINPLTNNLRPVFTLVFCYYQPSIILSDAVISGSTVLVRWDEV